MPAQHMSSAPTRAVKLEECLHQAKFQHMDNPQYLAMGRPSRLAMELLHQLMEPQRLHMDSPQLQRMDSQQHKTPMRSASNLAR
jgi:hypothetical protein